MWEHMGTFFGDSQDQKQQAKDDLDAAMALSGAQCTWDFGATLNKLLKRF